MKTRIISTQPIPRNSITNYRHIRIRTGSRNAIIKERIILHFKTIRHHGITPTRNRLKSNTVKLRIKITNKVVAKEIGMKTLRIRCRRNKERHEDDRAGL
ncbi:hypothetical protein B5G16_11695 [Alistipes sp. An66]|nr:hypothetical protein B5G16_11695 [Alistipes sp. An66]